jgi:Tfp pilus assembly protein PilE
MFQKLDVSPRWRRSEAGFTLAEVLVCAVVITTAFVALLTVIPYSAASTQSGNQMSTATFLANQKLEEAKSIPWTLSVTGAINDCLGLSNAPTVAPTVPGGFLCSLGGTTYAGGAALPWFADEGSTQITSPDGNKHFNGYSRKTRITNCGLAPGCGGITDPGMRLVSVSVTYLPMSTSSTAASNRTVTVSMIIAQR